jgi:hypothetical protein
MSAFGGKADIDQPLLTNLVLRRCTATDDHELLAGVCSLANDKARELGRIV